MIKNLGGKMGKKIVVKVMVLLFVSAMMLTVSCAKKTVETDPSAGIQNGSQDGLSAEEIARQKALEEERLREEALRKAIGAEKEKFEMEDIYFAFDSAELVPDARMILKEKADFLTRNSGLTVTIEGHCDERGTTEYNLALGEKRAMSAKKYLQDLGIAEFRLNTISYGEERPAVQGNDESAWSKNRRAHFVIR
jgi:peptidoglycan-associated lipoprotein